MDTTSGIVLERLEALMQARELGPGELAAQSGLSYNYVYKIRLGKAPRVSAVELGKLARTLGTSVEYLTGAVDSPDRPDAEPAYPIPPPGLVRAIVRLNEMDPEIRQYLVTLINLVVSMRESRARGVDLGDTIDILGPATDRLYDVMERKGLAPEERHEVEHTLEELADRGQVITDEPEAQVVATEADAMLHMLREFGQLPPERRAAIQRQISEEFEALRHDQPPKAAR